MRANLPDSFKSYLNWIKRLNVRVSNPAPVNCFSVDVSSGRKSRNFLLILCLFLKVSSSYAVLPPQAVIRTNLKRKPCRFDATPDPIRATPANHRLLMIWKWGIVISEEDLTLDNKCCLFNCLDRKKI